MLGRTLHEYVFIRVCILLLQYPIIPYILSLAACLAGAKFGQGGTHWVAAARCFFAFMVVELAYALLIWLPYTTRLGEAAKHPAPMSPVARRALFDRCMATVPNPESYLRGWFLGAELADIHRDNVRDFILWAFFDRGDDSISGPEHAIPDSTEVDKEADEYITRIEQLLGRPFKPGRGRVQSLRLTFDKIETRYRSFWWYIIVAIVDFITHILMVLNGFQYYSQPKKDIFTVFPPRIQQLTAQCRSSVELSYWHRSHQRTDCLPIVFFHGIGIGLWPYTSFLSEISAAKRHGHGQIGVIVLEILPISSRLTKPPLSKEAFLQQFTEILDKHSWDKFVLVSHSYGSVLTTHAIQCPEMEARIPRVVLIDPVSILLHLPDVAYNFTRRRPNRANEWQLWYFASTDPGVAHCLGRYFFWRENVIWAEELVGRCVASQSPSDGQNKTRRVTVCLSGQDLIVDSHAVARYLAEDEQKGDPAWKQAEGQQVRCNVAGIPGSVKGNCRSSGLDIDVLWFPQTDHAQVFDSKRDRRRIVDVLQGYCEE
ncbi:alpha beta hydrolase fold family [Colletotrichum truncatum]|uniref:Alpha beta hydrolase fold family n=1 Tax=Colletotrichum truncatum TaxID=5467 RepID=A0ACC3YS06_COLTU